jgi:hypothetical protein
MPTLTQQTAVSQAIDAIRKAENLLTAQIQSTGDTLTAIKLTHEYNNLDSYLSELLHAQNATDDAAFGNSSQSLKGRSDGLQADEKRIAAILGDVATAEKVVGYIAQALTIISKL